MNRSDQSDASPFVAQAFTISKLSGFAGKWLDVPAEKIGVVVYRNGKVRTFGQGRQLVLSLVSRLAGGGVGLRAGLIPAKPFKTWLRAGDLLSGDGELVDASLLCSIAISDPGRFLTDIVVPAGKINLNELDLVGSSSGEILNSYVQRYAAADLVRGLPTSQIQSELTSLLESSLETQGLRLEGVKLMSFKRAEDRVIVAQRAQELKSKLAEIEAEGKMAEAETKAKVQDFLNQWEPELVEHDGLRIVEERPAEAGVMSEDGKPGLADRLSEVQMWAKKEAGKLPQPWRLQSAFKRHVVPESATQVVEQHIPSTWWVRRTIWILVLIFGGYFLSRFVVNNTSKFGWEHPWELTGIIWAFVFGGVLESIKALYVKREQLSEAPLNPPDMISLYDLAGDNRKKVDQIVRSQSSKELAQIKDLLNDLRGQVYRAGNEDLALKLRELEGRFAHTAEQVGRSDQNMPAYLSDLDINQAAWEKLLAEDEELMARLAALGDDAHTLQQAFLGKGIDVSMVAQLEAGLNTWNHLYERRGQVFRAIPDVQASFRSPD